MFVLIVSDRVAQGPVESIQVGINGSLAVGVLDKQGSSITKGTYPDPGNITFLRRTDGYTHHIVGAYVDACMEMSTAQFTHCSRQ